MERFTRPIVEALQGLGLQAEASGRNDILVEGRKVSGTAQRLYGQALSDLMGYLVTHLTWDDGTPVVLEQYFDWRAQNDDEVLR